MSAKHPAAVAAFLKAHARDRLTLEGEIETYDNDDNEVTFGWRAAADVLAGEDAFDDDKCVAIGFLNDDLPLFVDVGKTALPLFAIAARSRSDGAGAFSPRRIPRGDRRDARDDEPIAWRTLLGPEFRAARSTLFN